MLLKICRGKKIKNLPATKLVSSYKGMIKSVHALKRAVMVGGLGLRKIPHLPRKHAKEHSQQHIS